jgi:hypothetical protein
MTSLNEQIYWRQNPIIHEMQERKLNNKVISYYLKPFPGYWLRTTLELFQYKIKLYYFSYLLGDGDI